MKYTEIRESKKHWKDTAAGWKYWRLTFICRECGYHVTDTIHGTEEQAKQYASNPVNEICQDCLSK